MQVGDLGRHDHAAAAAEHLDVRAAALLQQVDHVLEVFDMAALVAGNRDALRVFLQRGGDDFIDRAVVPEVDHLGTVGHQDAAHDVDRCIMAVEQRRGSHEAHLVGRFVFGEFLGYGEVGHCLSLCKFLAGKQAAEAEDDVYVNVNLARRQSAEPSFG